MKLLEIIVYMDRPRLTSLRKVLSLNVSINIISCTFSETQHLISKNKIVGVKVIINVTDIV